ncbi:MAG: hypothetical protein Dbin4_02620 [Alphaproteobacteria bacterium]|nr:hypothetical protein [Alphaproteobacteria bacterium]
MIGNTARGPHIVNRGRRANLAAFDLLPKDLRQALASAPFNYDATGVLKDYSQSGNPCAILEKLDALINRKLKCPFLGTAAVYGPGHPQARP